MGPASCRCTGTWCGLSGDKGPPDGAPDGVTALIASPGAGADLVLAPRADGRIPVEISIYGRDGARWTRLGTEAELGIARLSDRDDHTRTTWVPFRSCPEGPTRLDIPPDALDRHLYFELLVRIQREDRPPSVSKHHVVKNQLIHAGLFDLADALDHEATPARLLRGTHSDR